MNDPWIVLSRIDEEEIDEKVMMKGDLHFTGAVTNEDENQQR